VEEYYLLSGAANKAQVSLKEELSDYLQEPDNQLAQLSAADLSDFEFCFSDPNGSGEVQIEVMVKEIQNEGNKLNANEAAKSRLEQLTGLGEILSKRIKQKRDFNQLAELKSISGIGDETYSRLSSRLTIVGDNKLNINTASAELLETLPEVGPSLAERIIGQRIEEQFEQLSELKDISGIGEKSYQKIEDKVKLTSSWFRIKLKLVIPAREISRTRFKFIKASG
jgi:competence protein ComEA